MKEPIVVSQSQKGNISYVIGALIMSLLSLMLVFINFRSNHGILRILTQYNISYFVLKVIFVFGFLFFGYCFLFIINRARSGKAILIVDKEGITDNSSALAFGFIPWADIENIYIDHVGQNQFIELVLKNEEYYLKKMRGMKKYAVLINKKMGHQAVCITLNSSGIPPKELFPKILEMFEQVKLS